MTLPKPNLDDRNFTQLVDEAKKLIPRYAPQWTDHNLSDPGITFIDLFAWLTEITLYRINLITDGHRLKYLKLLRVRPRPPVPAKVDLTFESNEKKSLEKGRAVSAEMSRKSIFYELDEEIIIAPVKLEKVIVDELTGVFDRTLSNEQDDLFYAPFGLNAKKDCTLFLGFSRIDKKADALSLDKLILMSYLYEKDLKDPGIHDEESDFDFVNVKLKWEYYGIQEDGTKNWKNIKPDDATLGFKKSGRLIFKDLKEWDLSKIPKWKDKDEKKYLWLRCVVEDANFEFPPRLEAIRINTVSATNGLTVRNDNEPRISNGLPHQIFNLREKPVLDKTLALSVNESDYEKHWKEVDDFDSSGPDDNHFTLDREKGEIKFGDGLTGRVPPDGAVIKIIEYRIGGGSEGNIKAGYAWKIADEEGLKILDYQEMVHGTDAETIKEAILRFLKDMKVPYTTVTSKDFEYIAVNTPGLRVAKAKAVANYHPQMSEVKGSVTVTVIPFTPFETFESPPEPSEDFRMAICRHLDKHRLIGTNVLVVSPIYVKVDVSVTIVPVSGFSEGSLKSAIVNRLNMFLHPIRGGNEGDGWPIGENVSRSGIYEIIEKVEGVNCVIRLSLSGDRGSKPDEYGNLMLPSKTATVYSGHHTVNIAKPGDSCARERWRNGRD